MKDIFEHQGHMMEHVFKIGHSKEETIEAYRVASLALVDEVMEALHCTPWKPWSVSTRWDFDELHSELVDVFTFFVELCLLSGLDPDSLKKGFFDKAQISKARQDSGKYGIGTDENTLDITQKQLEVLYEAADSGECTSARVSCLIVGPDGEESIGWNRAFDGVPCTHSPKGGCPGRTIHAEVMALVDAASNGRTVKGGTAYVTKEPCDKCYYALEAAGVNNIWVV